MADLEQRVADVEDATDPTFLPALIDDLVERVGELALTVPTQEDLLDLRLHTARVATEVARVAGELRAEGARQAADHEDRLTAVLDEVAALHHTIGGANCEVHAAASPTAALHRA